MNAEPDSNSFDPDTDATAELPTIEPVRGATETVDSLHATDVLPALAVPVGTTELADRLREVEQRLEAGNARVRHLESLLQQAVQRQQELEHRLAESREQNTGPGVSAEAAIAHTPPPQDTGHRDRELAELRRQSDRQLEALCSWQGFRSVSDALIDEAESRNAMLESRILSLKESLHAREASAVQSRPQSQSEALKAEVNELHAQVASLRAELSVVRRSQPPTQLKIEPKAEDRRVSDRDRRSSEQADPPASASVVMYGDRWEYREEPDESPTGEVELLEKPPGESPVRALVRQDGGGDLIYPIGKRSTIGRTPDNDVRIDAPNVSRHHAVLLANAEHCWVEDLNSTNGVLVNGERVVRHELQDGDTLTIGRTEFRFMQRS